ncbi:MAG: sigma-70 family RNA polymerase sigma factor [Candidatus Neomarinimicrobiota bacterium]
MQRGQVGGGPPRSVQYVAAGYVYYSMNAPQPAALRTFRARYEFPGTPAPVTAAARTRAIDRIVRDYRQRLFRFIRSLVPTREDAEDILQDVLLQFTASFDEIRSLESAAAWLFSVARNRITDQSRRPSLGHQVDPSAVREGLLLEDLLPDTSIGPQGDFSRAELAQAIESALDDLPGPQRDVFIWHELQGLSFRDMAAITGEPLSTLLSRKRYAVLALRAALGEFRAINL